MSERSVAKYSQHRNSGIDFIRGGSILAVILLHINILLPFPSNQIDKILPHAIQTIVFKSGYYGVICFFVISGFLITCSIFEKWGSLSTLKISEFYQIRFARIVPCLLGLIAILSLLDYLHIKSFYISSTSLEKVIFSALTFQINWLEAKTGYLPANWGVLWSLSIEEIFYLFFPILCLLIRNRFIFFCVMLIFIFLGPFARVAWSNNEIWSDHSYLSCMDGISLGCLAAIFCQRKIAHSVSNKILFFGLVIFSLIFFFRHAIYVLNITRLGLNVTLLEISVALILMGIYKTTRVIYFPKIICWFGKNSYEIYLTHMFILISISRVFISLKNSSLILLILYMICIFLSGLLGHIVAKYFSQPCNRILRSQPQSSGSFVST